MMDGRTNEQPPEGYERWKREIPDTYRGHPFRRWVRHDKPGPINEVVEVPVNAEGQKHIRSIWERFFPDVYKWYRDEGSDQNYRWGWILFVKADW